MNQELQLKLQSYLDGEVSSREARRVAKLLEQNAEARALVGELRATRDFLAGNEPVVNLPESREFYWSKIQREILRAESAPSPVSAGWLFAWRRYLAPLAGVAFVMFLGLGTVRYYDLTPFDLATRHLTEVENHSEHTSSFSFRSHTENMFVVWVYDKAEESAAPGGADLLDDADETLIQ